MSDFSQFWSNILSSILGGVVVTLVAKVSLQHWKRWALGLGACASIAVVGGVVIFACTAVAHHLVAYQERTALQAKMDAFTKGHYPDDHERGYRVEVAETGQRALLVFLYPDDIAYPGDHPWNNPLFTSEMKRLLNDNGFPGEPVWGLQLKALKREQIDRLLERPRGS
jgi:hypothetical protein